MSNQFYNYLVEELFTYFKPEMNPPKPGERYYLRLDSHEEVINFVNSILNNPSLKVSKFEYRHEDGDPYFGDYIELQSVRFVIAYNSENVTTDYLALIRNLVSDQSPQWENTALLSIVSEQLDTIPGGSLDVQSDGMPLHVRTLAMNLDEKIQNSSLSKANKIVLSNYLERLIDELTLNNTSIFELEEILSILQKGEIEVNDYKDLGIFYDPEIDSYTGKSLTNRLAKNRELFEVVRENHEYNNSEDYLQKYFTDQGARSLLKPDWEKTLFTDVIKDHNKFNDEKKSEKVLYTSIKSIENLSLWDRPAGNTAAQKRKRHIIIFNEANIKEINLTTKFELQGSIKTLNKQYLVSNETSHISDIKVKNNSIDILIPVTRETLFTKIQYKHKGKAALGVELFICIISLPERFLSGISAQYLIDTKKKSLSVFAEGNSIKLTSKANEKIELVNIEDPLLLDLDSNYELILDEGLLDQEELRIKIKVNDVLLPITVVNQDTDAVPIIGSRIGKLVREGSSNMIWDIDRNILTHEHREYYPKTSYLDFFKWEYKWIDEGFMCGNINSGILEKETINLNVELREAYSRFISFFKPASQIPSLTTVCDEYLNRGKEYLKAFTNEVKMFENGKPGGSKIINLMKLGTITSSDTIYFTPFHPIMVAYKLKLYEELGNETVDNLILKRLTPESLIPFIDYKGLYSPQQINELTEWLIFKATNLVTASDTAQYLSNVVYDKIRQFKQHFKYLFLLDSKAPILINVINIPDDKEVLKGIIKFMQREISHYGPSHLKPIEVSLYSRNNLPSAFEQFSKLKSITQVESFIDEKFNSYKEYDAESILRLIRENLFYYKDSRSDSYKNVKYAHITYFKMQSQESVAIQSIDQMPADIGLHGLYTSISSKTENEDYVTGFGLNGYSIDESDYLIETAKYTNELISNSRNDGSDSYSKEHSIYSRVNNADEETLSEIFDKSHWVTFIEPTVDLSYFQDFKDELVVIHYSDQYTSSNKYDAITVTNKSNQYYRVIKEFLEKNSVNCDEVDINNAIKTFNTINGEWLLKIIGTNSYSDREKLSIISSIKYSLAILNHPNIYWVPISLEEILRIAGVFNLSKADGLFSAKNLGISGPASDDLLLIGIEITDLDIHLHFYPIEVKIGINNSSVIAKAKEQVQQTKRVLIAELNSSTNNFKTKFYKNFFVQILLANFNKIKSSGIWPEKYFNLSPIQKEKLMKLDFKIGTHLDEIIGIGGVISFKEGIPARTYYVEDQVLFIEFSKEDGLNGIVKEIDSVNTWIHFSDNDFNKSDFLGNRYIPQTQGEQLSSIPEAQEYQDPKSSTKHKEYQIPESISHGSMNNKNNFKQNFRSKEDSLTHQRTFKFKKPANLTEEITDEEIDTSSHHKSISISKDNNKIDLASTRVLLGKALNSTKDIYWEFGHQQLSNRHMLISGKSGQGKTYFMQCLLLELSKCGVSSLIVDYTEGFLPNQLEPEFLSLLDEKFKQRLVYNSGLPINPFARNIRTIGEIELPESNIDIAERIKSVFSSVYKSLGIQQLNTLYDKIIIGLERYDDKMSLYYLKNLLEEDGSSTALKTLSQLRPLIDRNPFVNQEQMNWKDHIDAQGDVLVIQLTGYPRDVQLLITEFLLWDLWNFTIRNGSKNNPLPVILDEAQNLDHKDESPTSRILTEGRKFGWSGWFATQFLKAQMDSSELARLQNSAQKVYFAQSDEDLNYIANTLANDEGDKKYWENRLINLKKGQCIVQGPILDTSGNLTKTQNIVVSITPLNERL